MGMDPSETVWKLNSPGQMHLYWRNGFKKMILMERFYYRAAQQVIPMTSLLSNGFIILSRIVVKLKLEFGDFYISPISSTNMHKSKRSSCSHSTHLDVSCFQPYKHYHSKAIDATMRTGIPEFGNLDFLASLTTIQRAKTFKKSTILSAFRKTGLILYNPGIV